MLKFRKINEDTKKSEEIKRISSEIDNVVNQWISDLKHEIITGSSIQNRGIWDRFKNFVANVWHGYDNKKNPYYFQKYLCPEITLRLPIMLRNLLANFLILSLAN